MTLLTKAFERIVPKQIQYNQSVISTSSQVSDRSLIPVDTSGGPVTVTLATALLESGKAVRVYDEGGSAGTNAITVDTEGAETIDPGGASSKSISLDDGELKLVGNDAGDTWIATNKNSEFERLNVNNLESGAHVLTQNNISNITVHKGDQVTVSSGTWQSIFDLGSSVHVIDGGVYGFNAVALRYTWGDDTTDTVSTTSTNQRGDDDGGNRASARTVYEARDVKKLEFYNNSGGSQDYGYEVITV